jgi:hypothetical protein
MADLRCFLGQGEAEKVLEQLGPRWGEVGWVFRVAGRRFRQMVEERRRLVAQLETLSQNRRLADENRSLRERLRAAESWDGR